MSSRSSCNIAPTSGSVLPVQTGVGVSQERVTTAEDAPESATVLDSEAIGWTVLNYKLGYVDFSDFQRLNPIFSDAPKAITNDQRGVKYNIDMGWLEHSL